MPKKLLALLLLIIAVFALIDLSRSARTQFDLAFGTPPPDVASEDTRADSPPGSTAATLVADTLTADAAAVVPSVNPGAASR